MDKIDLLIEHLLNNTESIGTALYYLGLDPLTEEELKELDNYIFQCDECGYWCEKCEENISIYGDKVCCDCVFLDAFED